jgi:putative oxidoreductase
MNDRNWSAWLLHPPVDGPRSIVAVRLMAGSVFFWEGILKFVYENQGVGRFTKLGMPFPQATASFVGGLEIVGGLLLVLGLGTRLVSATFVVEMLVAMLSTKPRLFLGTSPLALPPVPPQAGIWAVLHEVRSEYAQLISCAFLFSAGPGPLSLDARLALPDAVDGATSPVDRALRAARPVGLLVALAALVLSTRASAAGFPARPTTRCAPDAVVAGPACIDRFEASVWRVPNSTTTNRGLALRIRR